MGNGKGKRKEQSPQDVALLIQMTYRAHLAHRSQVLRCLRDLAVAKAKLKEIRSLFYNISYRHRIAHDHEEHQRFSEKIIVLLLTVDALEGPNYMVRTAKKSMLKELEGMLEIVDLQSPGKHRLLSRRKFDLPQGGAISEERMEGWKQKQERLYLVVLCSTCFGLLHTSICYVMSHRSVLCMICCLLDDV